MAIRKFETSFQSNPRLSYKKGVLVENNSNAKIIVNNPALALFSESSQISQSSRQNVNNNNKTSPAEYVPSFVLVDACKENNEWKIRDLVKKIINLPDCDVIANFKDPTGRTSLSYACSSGNVIIVDQLTKIPHLDPNCPDNEGNTPLHYASQAGHSEAVDYLLKKFNRIINPNARNSAGSTPLIKAALTGRTRIVKSLICSGAVYNLRDDSRGLTAVEWARLCGRHSCAEVILKCAKDNFQEPSPYTRLVAVEEERSSGTTSAESSSWLKKKIKNALGKSRETSRSTTIISSSRIHHQSQRSSMAEETVKLAIPQLQITPAIRR